MNILDTRDLYKRQCELQSDLDDLESDVSDAEDELADAKDLWDDREPSTEGELLHALEDAEKSCDKAQEALAEWKEEYQEDLDELNQLETEVGGEWMYGETLIPEDEFKNYAQYLAEDLHGDAIRDASWPFDHIDWEAAAEDLQMDYSSCEYQGTTYLFRG